MIPYTRIARNINTYDVLENRTGNYNGGMYISQTGAHRRCRRRSVPGRERVHSSPPAISSRELLLLYLYTEHICIAYEMPRTRSTMFNHRDQRDACRSTPTTPQELFPPPPSPPPSSSTFPAYDRVTYPTGAVAGPAPRPASPSSPPASVSTSPPPLP